MHQQRLKILVIGFTAVILGCMEEPPENHRTGSAGVEQNAAGDDQAADPKNQDTENDDQDKSGSGNAQSPPPAPPLQSSQTCIELMAINRTKMITDAAQRASPVRVYNVPGIGDCVKDLTGLEIYDYYCSFCHGKAPNTTIDARDRASIVRLIQTSEGSAANFPPGSLIGRDVEIDRLLAALRTMP